MKHRRDIDGLRALAIIPVVCYHTGLKLFSGGFIGVDVFFVISGFLISRVILEDEKNGGFSYLRFYERRVRRIMPALLFVLVVTVTAAPLVLRFPSDLAAFGKSVLATLFFSSNIFFWMGSGYFDASAWSKPLLHTWSLAVEEQFYIFYPFIFVFGMRRSRELLVGLLWVGLLASVSLALFLGPRSSGFFLAPPRAWELLTGGLLALRKPVAVRNNWCNEALGFLGLVLIVGAVIIYTEHTPFPGWAVLPPCIGAALIIGTGESAATLTARLLSSKAFVTVGLISYSLYLWHWPVLVFAKYPERSDIPWYAALSCIAAAVTLAVLSWRFVEEPVRRRFVLPDRGKLFFRMGGIGFAAAAIGTFLYVSQGLVWFYSPAAQKLLAFSHYAYQSVYRSGTCFLEPGNRFSDFQQSECLKVNPSHQTILVWGDSFAADLWSGLSAEFPGENILQATAASCAPVISIYAPTDACTRLREFVLQKFLPDHHVDIVLMSARWKQSGVDPQEVSATIDAVRKVSNAHILLVGSTVEYQKYLADLLGVGAQSGEPDLAERFRVNDNMQVDAQLRRIAQSKRVLYFSPLAYLCATGTCATLSANGEPLQWDDGHFTLAGSRVIARALKNEHLLPP